MTAAYTRMRQHDLGLGPLFREPQRPTLAWPRKMPLTDTECQALKARVHARIHTELT